MTKVNAFRIKQVGDALDWMFSDPDDRSSMVYGYNAKESVRVEEDMMKLFDPQVGDYYIVWPHGLTTFRDPESFAKDFTYLSGTVYETELVALFQKGMMSPEGQVELARERDERKRLQEERWEKRGKEPLVRTLPGGIVVRSLVPNPMSAPEAMVQPRIRHVSLLPLLQAFKPFK